MNEPGPLESTVAQQDRYDLIVIGSGPAGHHAAIEAAKVGKKVIVVDRMEWLGGACLHTGTIPSKTLREAVLYWSGFRQRTFYGKNFRLRPQIQLEDLMFRVAEVVKRHYEVIVDQLQRNGVKIANGWAKFAGPHSILVDNDSGSSRLSADYILVACGTRPARGENIPFNESNIYDSDQFVRVTVGELPKSLIVVGGGVIGLEYASMMATLGVAVTVVEARESLLEHVDAEISETLSYNLRRAGVSFRLGETVSKITAPDAATVIATLESGKSLSASALLYAVGRQPNTDRLDTELAGFELDQRGRIKVNERYQTSVPHIYAAGDVVGAPALASASMAQGRLASRHMFGLPTPARPDLLPFGIYTIPEISMVGRNERQLTEAQIPYETGVAPFEEIAKAQISGDRVGLLKLIFHAEDLSVLGVHIVGEGASELVHIGHMAMLAGGTVETLAETVFNYPSLAEAYRAAATNGLDKLHRNRLPDR
jgi:NAD(P) transhydrogenase